MKRALPIVGGAGGCGSARHGRTGLAVGRAARRLRGVPRQRRRTPHTLDGLAFVGFSVPSGCRSAGRVLYISPTQGPGTVLTSVRAAGLRPRRGPTLRHPIPVDDLGLAPASRGSGVRGRGCAAGLPPKRHGPNVHRVVFRSEQAAYPAGYLSALMAQRKGEAADGQRRRRVPLLRRDPLTIVGFRAGARKAGAGDHASAWTTPTTSRTRPSAGGWPSGRSRLARASSSTSPGLRARAHLRGAREGASGASASTSTSRSSGRTSSRAPPSTALTAASHDTVRAVRERPARAGER